jgi:amphi-Trp domain-containing protein
MEISSEKTQEGKKVIQGEFSQEFYMNKGQVATFLRKLADEIEQGNELKISTDEWELPFQFRDEVEVEIDAEHDELEIELEFEKYRGNNLSVE